ncbi:hypothetical protein [Chamaesiphon sp. OTE_75_metabat_556]|nr:hypothetical protein [Chamaesiphon sp. OTE_75_metabat_556]
MKDYAAMEILSMRRVRFDRTLTAKLGDSIEFLDRSMMACLTT